MEILLLGGGINTAASNEQRSNYEKSSARKSRRLDTYGFCRLRRKLTARRTAVGPSGRAGRFGGRVHQHETTMHDAPRRLAAMEQTQTDETGRPGCPGCPGGVLGGVPLSGTPQDRQHGASTRRIHSKISKVSRVSWVILKTIACRCGCAHMRPEDGFAKQPGHPGHLSKLTMVSALSRLLPSFLPVPDRESPPGTPQDTQDTRRCEQ